MCEADNTDQPRAVSSGKKAENVESEAQKEALKVSKSPNGDEEGSHHLYINGEPQDIAARAAHRVTKAATGEFLLGNRWKWANWAWLVLFTVSLPGIGSLIWWGLVPVGSPVGDARDKLLFVLLVHPVSATCVSYLLCSVFLIALDEENPWRPMRVFVPTLAAVYAIQVLFPGLITLLHEPFELNALPALATTIMVTLWGIRRTPYAWLGSANQEKYNTTVKVFTRVCIVFMVYTWVLAGYTYAVAGASGALAGILAAILSILAFIFKKIVLGMTDPIGLDAAMLLAGFWIENLTDIFITLAFPTAEEFGVTFGIIFFIRVVENAAYLGFQLDAWFKFRLWIKGKSKKDQAEGIEEDLEEYQDDRGHSAFHPGYRRRQLRFLLLKFFSQISSYIYFVLVMPVLRYGPNKERFPYQDEVRVTEEHRKEIFPDSRLPYDRWFLDDERFTAAMTFSVFQLIAVILGGMFVWWWMNRYCHDILMQVKERYKYLAVVPAHYALILSTLVSNALIGTSFVHVYYRVFFV